MVGSNWKQVVVAALVSALIVSVTVPAFAGSAATTTSGTVPGSGEVFEVSDNVSAWERAILPLRADTSNAAYTLANADWQVENADGDQTSLNRDPIPVYEDGQDVTVAFDPARANKGDTYFEGERAQVIIAHVDETGSGDVPRTTSEAVDLLTLDNANDNVTFDLADIHYLDEGVNARTDTAESGHTIYFLATVEDGKDGVDVSHGDITDIDGDITVIGMEHVAVRDGPGSVHAPDSVTRGDTASFDVDASTLDAAGSGQSIEQGVIVYDEDTYADQSFLVELDEAVNRDFDVDENATLHSDIDEVNGVARADGSVGMFGVDVGDGEVARSAGLGTLVDFVGEEAGTDMPDVEDGSSDTVVLDASSTLLDDSNPSQTVQVETFANWSTGEYRWVYVAVGADSQDTVSQTGTLTVTKKSSDSGDDHGDTEPPTATLHVPETVTAGDPVTVKATDVSDPSGIAHICWYYDGEVGPDGKTMTVTFEETGTHTVSVRLVDGVGNEQTLTRTIEVVAADDSGDSDDGNHDNPDDGDDGDSGDSDDGNHDNHDDGDDGDSGDSDGDDSDDSERGSDTTDPADEDETDTETESDTDAGGDDDDDSDDPDPASIEVASATLGATYITVGNAVDVSATLENTGDTTGSETLRITAGEHVLATQRVTVGAGETVTETVSVTFDEAGTYDVAVNGIQIGTLTVADRSTTDSTPGGAEPPEDAGGLPLAALGAGAVVAGLGGAVYFLRIR